MGSDAFIGFYGISFTIPEDSDFTAIEEGSDERIYRARCHRLNHILGRITDGRDYHLLIGKRIADLGLEGDEAATYSDGEFAAIQAETKNRLKEAGFLEEPKLIFKFHAQH